ncbi:MAG: SAM-dependent methyltransferase [Acidobacteria bacterium]|nr:MAG: SAM-dependent methyltransferase [Acidobacteriota bacterium]REK02423.1 MAG: SAM-dependent methyltransferase [Acidobacteriota bacterium]REK13776.1 MAG: SAM-dependent methyltransferase [Acidobacteriota bacterium]REK41770.1 MAG: SAM-dependent methyltransferase [Acidobacteriota bacterium]
MPEMNLDKFIDAFAKSLSAGTFVKATVGNYKGGEKHLQKVLLRKIETKRGDRIQFVSRFEKKDSSSNHTLSEAPLKLRRLFSKEFRSGHLFTTVADLQLTVSKRGKVLISESSPTFEELPEVSHDRKKDRVLDPSRNYLHLLGLTSRDGRVKDKSQAKYRQIERFVAILDKLLIEAGLVESGRVTVLDLGSGKGYLTFALYDHLTGSMRLDASVRGIEERRELVDKCNHIAKECDYSGLAFEQGSIGDVSAGEPDVLIALHACDTATDDALFEGISTGAKAIVVAPCCQHELRSQLRFPESASALNEFGLLLERETESVTDGIRALILKGFGYRVKMQEFVASEHTPKNNLITAVLGAGPGPSDWPLPAVESLLEHYGISRQRLHSLLSDRFGGRNE